MSIETINAITFVVRDMARSVSFYEHLGFSVVYGGTASEFTSLCGGQCFVNLSLQHGHGSVSGWGRVIFHVDDVDKLYEMALEHGYTVENAPQDAAWGERYFHIWDPDGHELSFARLLSGQ